MAGDTPLYTHTVIEGFDAEALLGVVRDARFEQRLLASGHFRAGLQRVVFPRFSLDCGDYSLPIFASGSFGRDVVALALAISCREPMWANGSWVRSGQVMMFAEDSELNVRPPPGGWRWAVLLIGREDLQVAAMQRLGHELPLPRRGWDCCDPPAGASRSLSTAIAGALRDAARWGPVASSIDIGGQAELLLDAFIDAIDCAMPGDVWSRGFWMVRRREEAIRKAEHLLAEQLDRPFASDMLSSSLGLGERRIERLFRDAYGLAPRRWHISARLNAARRMLQQPDIHMGVTQVAVQLGFTHLGRFSSEYFDLFGERPVDTLRGHRAIGIDRSGGLPA